MEQNQMKKIKDKKWRVHVLLLLLLCFLMPITTKKVDAAADGFRVSKGYTYYYKDNKKQTGLLTIDGSSYWFDSKGRMQTGWIEDSKGRKRYFYKKSGIMATGWVSNSKGQKRYFYRGSGYMAVKWVKNGNNMRYFNPQDGFMYTGLKKVGKDIYYFDSKSGYRFQGGFKKIGENTYYFQKSDGCAKKGWLTIANRKYSFASNGVMNANATAILDGKTYVFAASDYHQTEKTLTAIVNRMLRDYPNMDGVLFAGDYTNDHPGNANVVNREITSIKQVFTTAGWAPSHQVFAQGNHDGAGNYDSTGAHDTKTYGVYLINEDDFPANQSSRTAVKKVAVKLKKYLDKKSTAKYKKPIFVMSHLPLHDSWRNDNKYACEIFNVLNSYSNLTIIYLFGHNHSNTYDSPIGHDIFLTRGDKMNVPQGSASGGSGRLPVKKEKLNFTYMNAGYAGYNKYGNLTATVFEITNKQVVIKRYSKNGVVSLKTAGTNNTKTYASPQILKIK